MLKPTPAVKIRDTQTRLEESHTSRDTNTLTTQIKFWLNQNQTLVNWQKVIHVKRVRFYQCEQWSAYTPSLRNLACDLVVTPCFELSEKCQA